jgi:hypothetical protein
VVGKKELLPPLGMYKYNQIKGRIHLRFENEKKNKIEIKQPRKRKRKVEVPHVLEPKKRWRQPSLKN